MASDVEHPFICLWALWMSSLEKCLFRSFAHILIRFFAFLGWSHVSSIFGDQTLVWGIISKYIFPYGWFPFHFADVFFNCAEAFYFDEVSFVYSFLMSLALGNISVKIFFQGISEIFLPIFSSRTFMVPWHIIFKSFIHLELIFVYGVSWWSSFFFFSFLFFFFACSCEDLPAPFVEEAIFTPFYTSTPLCWILIDHRNMDLFLGSLFCSTC